MPALFSKTLGRISLLMNKSRAFQARDTETNAVISLPGFPAGIGLRPPTWTKASGAFARAAFDVGKITATALRLLTNKKAIPRKVSLSRWLTLLLNVVRRTLHERPSG